MSQKYYLVVCKKRIASMFYNEIKKENVHFALIRLDSATLDFQMDTVSILFVNNEQQVLSAVHAIRAGDELSSTYKSYLQYGYAFAIRKLKCLTSKALIASELKLDKLIPHEFQYMYSYHDSANEFRKFPVYERQKHFGYNSSILIIENTFGYGDSISTMPLLQGFARRKIKEGFSVEILHTYEQSFCLSTVMLNMCDNHLSSYEDSRADLDHLPDFQYADYQRYNFDGMIVMSAGTKLKERAEFLDFNDYKDILNQAVFDFSATPKECLSILDTIKQTGKPILGVQFYTQHDKTCSYQRSWPISNVKIFLDLCKQNGIEVVNLAPYEGVLFEDQLDWSTLKVDQIFGIVNKLDLFVGIDSFCGHIAGVLKVPNITLWGKVLTQTSQRPLSMNLSIISKTKNVADLLPRYVFEKAMNLLSGIPPMTAEIKEETTFFENETTIYL